ncbi:MAG: GvpL/GvpF family gas vesicle protein [Gemmatimonadaceae bacterium]|nr:GvpL/GvpF family gas vesicle protein [Gemmatimonadaceae bacterium]
MAQASINGLRLYGVAAHESGSVQPLAEGTTLIPFRALAAVVAPSRYSRVVLDEKEMAEYSRILEEVQTAAAVLPAPPGTVFRSRDNLSRWLELHYFTLTQAMGSIEGHSQARLTITKNLRVDAKDGTTDELKETTKQFQATAAHSMRVLRGQAAATVVLPLPEGGTNVIAQASFLVDTERWNAFSDLVAQEDERQTSLEFRISGPWPPYDFVRMQFGG